MDAGRDGGSAPDASRDAGSDLDAGSDGGLPLRCERRRSDLVRRREADPARAERGRRALIESSLAPGVVPRMGIENLWIVWGTGPLSGEAYWSRFRERYGFVAAPFENDGLPMGIRDTGDGSVGFDCLSCHAGEVAGRAVIGAPNSLLDFESLYDDLVLLNERAPDFGYPTFPVPFDLDGFTTAAGAMDAFGLAMELSTRAAGGGSVATDYGPQRATAWWVGAYKGSLYTDGIGQAEGHRTMMAMLLAFGLSQSELMAMDEEMEDIAHFLRSLEAPCWDQGTIDEEAADRGQLLFDRECAGCHGVHSGEAAAFPDAVIDLATVGTDPMRSASWTEAEAAWVNASWYGEPPMRDTDGYLAQPLVGIWARAPYLHNGAVPDLRSLLVPEERPLRWRRLGSDAASYDPERVGWRYEEVAVSPDPTPGPDGREGRQVVDTERPGLGAEGHLFGGDLSESERADLLMYLRTL